MAVCFESVVGAQANLTSAQRVAIAVLCCLLLGFFVATVVLAFGSGGSGGGEAAHHRGTTTTHPPTTTSQSHPPTSPTTPHPPVVNSSAGWKRAAAYLLEGLDESVQPCDDFYKFACNSIVKKVPKNKTVNVDADYDAWLERELVAFAKSNHAEPFPLNMLKNALNNCFNMHFNTEARQLAELVRGAIDKYGGFPLENGTAFNATLFKPFTTMYSTLAISADIQMAFVFVDGSSKVPHLLPVFPPNRDDYEETIKPFIVDKLQKTKEFRKQYNYFGIALTDDERISEHLNTLLELMDQLSLFAGNETEQTVSLGSLNDARFGDFYDSASQKLAYKKLGDETLVKLRVEAFKKVVALVQSDVKYKKAMQTYIMMRLVDGYYQQYFQLDGVSVGLTREEACIGRLFRKVPELKPGFKIVSFQAYWMLATHYLAKKTNVTPEVVRFAEKLLGELRGSFGQRLAKLDWLSLSDYRKLSRRVRTITPYIGMPQWLFNLTSLSKAYEGFDVTPNGSFLYDTVYKTTNFFTERMFYGQLVDSNGATDIDYWTNTALASPWTLRNAYYRQLPSRKVLAVAFPMLEEPITASDLPPAVNYGTIGFIMGHELMHGFGWKFMNMSNLKLSENAAHHLTSDFNCLVRQYGNISYTIAGEKVFINGAKTLFENMPDNGGIGLAYDAFLANTGMNQEERMPGVMKKFDGKQTFFLSMARKWCEHRNDTDLKHQIETDVHPPSRTRITQTLQNFPPFAAAFHCKPGSFMNPNPADRCTVW